METTDTVRKAIERFELADQRILRLVNELSSARCELANATNDLGSIMSPKDATTDEVFNIWFSNGLLKVKVLANKNYEISWRTRPTKL